MRLGSEARRLSPTLTAVDREPAVAPEAREPEAAEVQASEPPAAAADRPASRRPRRARRLSMLTLSILAVNVLALAILLGGLLYLDQYREGLIEAKISALTNEANIIAGALGQRAILGTPEQRSLDSETASAMVRRFFSVTHRRSRIFDHSGELIVDSRELLAAGRDVQFRELPPPETEQSFQRLLERVMTRLSAWLPLEPKLPFYNEAPDQRAADYNEVVLALTGETASARRLALDDSLVLTVAVPIQNFKMVLGALLLSADDADIEQSVHEVRSAILRVFALALAITILMSIFLAHTIARPIRRLAESAERVRRRYSRRVTIPDFSTRRDEIGDLSIALAEMTSTLYDRLDAIEAFAADVAHEIKNPLSSLRSAIEVFQRIEAPERRRQLIDIMQDDIARLDRLISEISDASRLDAELSRAEAAPVDIGRLLQTAVQVHRATAPGEAPRIELVLVGKGELLVNGIEERLGQVVRNLIANAISFAAADSTIRLLVYRREDEVELAVEDEGPGIPEENLEKVFERFYTLRPDAETFGAHSGLGLSISRQIVEAHGGSIHAENRYAEDGAIRGARLVVRLPALI